MPASSPASRADVPPALKSGWVVCFADGLQDRAVRAACCTLANGHVGTRGDPEEAGGGHVLVAGCFAAGRGIGLDATPTLLRGPGWQALRFSATLDGDRWRLDLRHGVLHRETALGSIRTSRFVSLARPGVSVSRAEGPTDELDAGQSPTAPRPPTPGSEVVDLDGVVWTSTPTGWIAVAATTSIADHAGRRVVERRAVVHSGRGPRPDPVGLRSELEALDDHSFDALRSEHEEAFERRWADADVTIVGDPDLQLAVRFSLFHLIGSVASTGEAAVGARGLSGPAYRGHVFWDADVFVLPFLAATHPPAARAMLAYRMARLPAAEEEAARLGRAGARFPWESADDGRDVTPLSAIDLRGRSVPILTGRYQEHITADVAWAAAHYLDWTGDVRFGRSEAKRLLVATARYWRSRCSVGEDGRAHLLQVMGPDEYHAPVDDNAFTNAMARWNLRRAAAAVAPDDLPSLVREATAWRQLADVLEDGYEPTSGSHEQFRGFDQLEPTLLDGVTPMPLAADVMFGHERVAATQTIKQADVLMIHHLLPGTAPAGSLRRDLDRYLPCTAHGSSLSPGIHASLLARAGRPDEALPWFRLAATMDLQDRTRTTAGGLHLATAGSVWQAVVMGFLGAHPDPDGMLRLDPSLPSTWDELTVRLRFRGASLLVRAAHGRLTVDSSAPVHVVVDDRPYEVSPAGLELHHDGGAWRRAGR
jgi:trehalose/maltose hydrolase-like predicted phosphorylase